MERLLQTLLNLLMHNAHVCYPQEKWPTLCMAIKGRERLISETHGFKENATNFLTFVVH